jgi:hypothetical protein
VTRRFRHPAGDPLRARAARGPDRGGGRGHRRPAGAGPLTARAGRRHRGPAGPLTAHRQAGLPRRYRSSPSRGGLGRARHPVRPEHVELERHPLDLARPRHQPRGQGQRRDDLRRQHRPAAARREDGPPRSAPVITSGSTATFTQSSPGYFAVTTTALPVATFTETGALPAGLSFSSARSSPSPCTNNPKPQEALRAARDARGFLGPGRKRSWRWRPAARDYAGGNARRRGPPSNCGKAANGPCLIRVGGGMRAPELPDDPVPALDALAGLAGAADAATLAALRDRLAAARLRVLVVGEAKRGKSTLVNALLGREVLPARAPAAPGRTAWPGAPHRCWPPQRSGQAGSIWVCTGPVTCWPGGCSPNAGCALPPASGGEGNADRAGRRAAGLC